MAASSARQPASASWNYDPGEDPQKLGFGVDGTDMVGLILECDRGAGRVKLWTVDSGEPTHAYRAHWSAHMALASGGHRHRYAARGKGADLGEMRSVEVSTDDPVLTAFGASGRLSFDGVPMNAKAAAERPMIRGFFQACAAPR